MTPKCEVKYIKVFIPFYSQHLRNIEKDLVCPGLADRTGSGPSVTNLGTKIASFGISVIASTANPGLARNQILGFGHRTKIVDILYIIYMFIKTLTDCKDYFILVKPHDFRRWKG
mgnify:CR=1 FL=1